MGVKGGCLAGGMRFSAQSAEGECSAWALLPVKGGILFPKRTPPLEPPEKDEESPPRPRTLAVCSSKSCAACGIGCGVHGFAMNPYYPLPIATAPYCREARVTLERRQTACGMRHCCARRIVETGGKRKLGCTSTRWAERHPQGVCRIRKAAEPPKLRNSG